MASLEVPEELSAELKKNKPSETTWNSLAPSHQREHAKYVADAKHTVTRQRRAVRTIQALLRPAP